LNIGIVLQKIYWLYIFEKNKCIKKFSEKKRSFRCGLVGMSKWNLGRAISEPGPYDFTLSVFHFDVYERGFLHPRRGREICYFDNYCRGFVILTILTLSSLL
jgi:hypothetical protein